jgi:hypothetical protein
VDAGYAIFRVLHIEYASTVRLASHVELSVG